MKYKVIGWTFSEDKNVEDGEITFAVRHAIVDDIKANGYFFSGEDHQEAFRGCPILNDGKKRAFSQRGFAGIMAESRGETDPYAYSRYMFGIKSEYKKMPTVSLDKSAKKPMQALQEKFELDVDERAYMRAVNEKNLVIEDVSRLRYIDAGDTLVLKNSEGVNVQMQVTVSGVDRFQDVSMEERLLEMANFEDKTGLKQRQESRNNTKILLKITWNA